MLAAPDFKIHDDFKSLHDAVDVAKNDPCAFYNQLLAPFFRMIQSEYSPSKTKTFFKLLAQRLSVECRGMTVYAKTMGRSLESEYQLGVLFELRPEAFISAMSDLIIKSNTQNLLNSLYSDIFNFDDGQIEDDTPRYWVKQERYFIYDPDKKLLAKSIEGDVSQETVKEAVKLLLWRDVAILAGVPRNRNYVFALCDACKNIFSLAMRPMLKTHLTCSNACNGKLQRLGRQTLEGRLKWKNKMAEYRKYNS